MIHRATDHRGAVAPATLIPIAFQGNRILGGKVAGTFLPGLSLGIVPTRADLPYPQSVDRFCQLRAGTSGLFPRCTPQADETGERRSLSSVRSSVFPA